MISTEYLWGMFYKGEATKFDEPSGHWYNIPKYVALARTLHENGWRTDKEGLQDYLVWETYLNCIERAFVRDYMRKLEAFSHDRQ